MAVVTAHINLFLAAKQLDLPKCSRLIIKEEFVIVEQCEAKVVNFTTYLSGHCGARLRLGEMMVSPILFLFLNVLLVLTLTRIWVNLQVQWDKIGKGDPEAGVANTRYCSFVQIR